MIVAGDDEHEKLVLKEHFVTQVEIKDLGKLKCLFRIEVINLKGHLGLPKGICSKPFQRKS